MNDRLHASKYFNKRGCGCCLSPEIIKEGSLSLHTHTHTHARTHSLTRCTHEHSHTNRYTRAHSEGEKRRMKEPIWLWEARLHPPISKPYFGRSSKPCKFIYKSSKVYSLHNDPKFRKLLPSDLAAGEITYVCHFCLSYTLKNCNYEKKNPS